MVWLDPANGAPTVYINKDQDDSDSLGWYWSVQNNGAPVASGAAPAQQVLFGDMDGDGRDDYLTIDAKTGALHLYLNNGPVRFSSRYLWYHGKLANVLIGFQIQERMDMAV